MTKTQCVTGCGRPTKGTMLCTACLSHLQRDLGDITALGHELEITSTRQSVTGARNGSRSTTKPLPFNWSADHDLDDLHATLVGWIRTLGPDVIRVGGPVCDDWCTHMSCNVHGVEVWPKNTLHAMANWLLRHATDLAKNLAADEIADEIHYAVGQARRAIDRRIDRWYAGPCRGQYAVDPDTQACCLADLYTDPAAELFVCDACRTVHKTEERRVWLIAEANDQLAHATLIADALSGLGYTVTSDRIRKWAERGRIEAKGVTAMQGWPTYRVGDVIERLAEDLESRDRRAKKAEESARREQRVSA